MKSYKCCDRMLHYKSGLGGIEMTLATERSIFRSLSGSKDRGGATVPFVHVVSLRTGSLSM